VTQVAQKLHHSAQGGPQWRSCRANKMKLLYAKYGKVKGR